MNSEKVFTPLEKAFIQVYDSLLEAKDEEYRGCFYSEKYGEMVETPHYTAMKKALEMAMPEYQRLMREWRDSVKWGAMVVRPYYEGGTDEVSKPTGLESISGWDSFGGRPSFGPPESDLQEVSIDPARWILGAKRPWFKENQEEGSSAKKDEG